MDIELDNDEAIVLFEWISRITEDEVSEKVLDTIIEDESEKAVLWSVLCRLESRLVEPCYPNYTEILQTARKRIKEKYMSEGDCNE